MRNISFDGLTKLAEKLGNESVFIVEIDWAGTPVSYADRDVAGIPGRIVEISELDNIVGVTNNDSSEELSITLIDTDGSIKNILDTYDVHQRNVRVYQYFEGLDIADKFLLFAGKLSSPIIWSENKRTVRFTVISQLEDREFGFSAEEGQFPFLPKDLVGKAWPVIFGKVLDVPALRVNKAVTGTTLCGVGIVTGGEAHENFSDTNGCGIGLSLGQAFFQINHLNRVSAAYDAAFEHAQAAAIRAQVNEIRTQAQKSAGGAVAQKSCTVSARSKTVADAESQGQGCNPIRILGGEDFLQNTSIELNIGGGIFRGRMQDDKFHVSSRRFPIDETTVDSIVSAANICVNIGGDNGGIQTLETQVPFVTISNTRGIETIKSEAAFFCSLSDGSATNTNEVMQHRWFEPGTRVSMHSDEPITYIVSITPGTVLAVKAYKQFEGIKKLVNVPNDLWQVQTVTYGSITAVQVVTTKPLSTIPDQGWEDDLYVTFESTIGPNIIDILKYIITNYTNSDLTWDSISFDAVAENLEPFPANFPVLDRRNTIDVLRDIAFQARCALLLNNGVFYIKYLPEEPGIDDTITVSDIYRESVEVTLTSTENLVTKMVVLWRLSWADGNGEKPERIILRHNVKKYGTKEKEFDFFIYNQPDIVLKCATFWLIRNSNTWKQIRFSVPLTKLQLETFDTVSLDLPNYVASSAIKAIVQKANYNSDTYQIDMECWVPVKAGTMDKYKFAWPSSLTVTDVFPTPEEVAAGFAGGGGIGVGATGELPIGFTDGIESGGTVFVGGPNIIYRAHSDHGDKTPTDAGFTAQTVFPAEVFAEVTNVEKPKLNLQLVYTKYPEMNLADLVPARPTIDIHNTPIGDIKNGAGGVAYLSDVIDSIQDHKIYLKSKVNYVDPADNKGEFEVKFDDDSSDFAAKKAFLKEDE